MGSGGRSFMMGSTLVVFACLFVVSCAGTVMKGYSGAEMAPDKTALIRSGPYADIGSCDGVMLGRSHLSVVVAPGPHTIQVSYVQNILGDTIYYYSRTNASLVFDAEAGHSYVVYGDMTSPETWVASVVDKTSSRKIVRSEPLKLESEQLIPRGGPSFGGSQ